MQKKLETSCNLNIPLRLLSHSIYTCEHSPLLSHNKFKDQKNISDFHDLIGIGASTGGTQALHTILEALPKNMPPIFIVQHIPANFSKALSESLNKNCELEVCEAEDKMIAKSGFVYLAPGNKHMEIVLQQNHFVIHLSETEKVGGHRPSVDVLFESLSKLNSKKTVGILLTGMGSDGALGLKKMKDCGAKTLAQNEESSVVFGMPKKAIELGAADEIKPLSEIAPWLVSVVTLENFDK